MYWNGEGVKDARDLEGLELTHVLLYDGLSTESMIKKTLSGGHIHCVFKLR